VHGGDLARSDHIDYAFLRVQLAGHHGDARLVRQPELQAHSPSLGLVVLEARDVRAEWGEHGAHLARRA
jgi:hypothetical protein